MRKLAVMTAVIAVTIAVFAGRLVCLGLGCVLYVYLLPGLVARDRCHSRQRTIQLCCVLFGWAVVPWVIGLWVASKGPVQAPCFRDFVPAGSFDE